MLETSLLFGGQVVRSIDLATGEIIAMRQQVALSSSGGGSLAGDRHVEASLSTCHISPKMEYREGASILSTCHISPKMEYREGASILTVKRSPKLKKDDNGDEDKPKQEEKRGKVAGFSAKSRNRLMRTLAGVRRECLPVFVTLTFPAQYPTIERAKRDLDTFIKRLARKFSSVAGVWKLEPQKRGSPHFHLLVWGVSYSELLLFVPVAWCEVVGSEDPNHLAWHKGELGNSPCVQRIESQRGVFWYASKYMSKEVGSQFSDWGRWWGVFYRNNLPLGQVVNVEVTEQKAIEFIRYMRRFGRIRSRDYRSLTIICNADFWINRLL